MMRFYFTFTLLIFFFLFQCSHLCFAKNESILRYFGFQRFESFLKCFQIMPQPYTSDRGWCYYLSSFPQFITYPQLTVCRLLGSVSNYQVFYLFVNAILQKWFTAAYFLQCKLTTLLIQLLKTIETVS